MWPAIALIIISLSSVFLIVSILRTPSEEQRDATWKAGSAPFSDAWLKDKRLYKRWHEDVARWTRTTEDEAEGGPAIESEERARVLERRIEDALGAVAGALRTDTPVREAMERADGELGAGLRAIRELEGALREAGSARAGLRALNATLAASLANLRGALCKADACRASVRSAADQGRRWLREIEELEAGLENSERNAAHLFSRRDTLLAHLGDAEGRARSAAAERTRIDERRREHEAALGGRRQALHDLRGGFEAEAARLASLTGAGHRLARPLLRI
eukprot:tig00000076_g2463.t1